MNTETINILVAQSAGGDGFSFIYDMVAPGAISAIFVVMMIVAIGLIIWLFEFFIDRN